MFSLGFPNLPATRGLDVPKKKEQTSLAAVFIYKIVFRIGFTSQCSVLPYSMFRLPRKETGTMTSADFCLDQ